MGSIKENYESVRTQVEQAARDCGRDPGSVTLIGVSKKKSVQSVLQAIEAGAGHLGENYIQEAVEKIDAVGKERACWHFIGHLQSNKARFAVNCVEYIHTVDKVKLAREIDRQARKIKKIQKVLIEVNIARETTKAGVPSEDVLSLAREISQLENLSLQGLMCMPPFFDDPEQARPYFRDLAGIRDRIRTEGLPRISMTHLSMGMSHDFRVAIEEGATMVRVGTAIFGSRQ